MRGGRFLSYDRQMCDPGVTIRPAHPSDRRALAAARAELLPNATREEHEAELAAILAGRASDTLPRDPVADAAGALVGFVEIGERSHADGCDSRRPVAFVEGWYVAPDRRRRGIGRALIAAAEDWPAAWMHRNGIRHLDRPHDLAARARGDRFCGRRPMCALPQAAVVRGAVILRAAT